MEFPNKKQKKTNVRHLHTLEEESVLSRRLQTSSAPTVSSQPRTELDDDPRVSSQSQITVDRLLYSSDEDGNTKKKFSHQRLPPRILSPSRYLDLMDSQGENTINMYNMHLILKLNIYVKTTSVTRQEKCY